MGALKIPDALVERASLIPGLNERVARFIQLEIVQHEQRMKRFRPETLEMVARAKKQAETQKSAGYEAAKVKQSFDRHLQELTDNDSYA